MFSRFLRRAAFAAFVSSVTSAAAHAEDLRGHGGPVGALAVSESGSQVLSGSFDTRSILWSTQTAAAARIMRVHEGNVTAVAFLPEGRLATGGQDGRLAIWAADDATVPEEIEPLHEAPVAMIAVSDDGALLATGGWDGRIWLRRLDQAEGTGFDAHQGPVNGLGFLPEGRLASVGQDLRLRVWSASDAASLANMVDLPSPPSSLAVTHTGLLAVTSADGVLRLVDPERGIVSEAALSERPVVTVTAAAQAPVVAAASVEGHVWILDAETLEVRHLLQPDQGPVWSLGLDAGGRRLFTGGGDGLIRRWDASTGAALGSGGAAGPQEEYDDASRGAQVWRSCAACHTLASDDGNRAGPTLHGIFGRQIGTAEGYDYSQALLDMDIIWTPQTVSELFEHGPEAYTPGTRMPEQRITSAEDRAALMEFLERATQ
ncbi:c-type cytochrome [Mesorhizobium sp. YIM 152430]|uniref:c-type cytochrome n=1 Tax=Mesorhizobium sp. YIM 152430 TaxID=3031761 RepID=UPI0023DC96CB|nr:c-type cytochrome [Mesorhizobium sp. YIM 152430]MDF1598707.1 c-type cytochrome [Mesorhizobium sp. YIM 152430]